MQIFFHVLLHKKWCLKRRRRVFPLFIFPTRWQVFPHCVLGFATKQFDYISMTKPFIIVVCQNSLMISSKAMREWARKIVVILHHTKDIRKLSYEKEKARNSVQWYGIYDQWVPRELFSVSFIALRTRICESLKMPRMSSHLMWQIDNDLYKAAQLFWADRLRREERRTDNKFLRFSQSYFQLGDSWEQSSTL